MSIKKVCVTIPVYKPHPDKDEILSFKQCLSVLVKYDISIFTMESLDLSEYQKIADSLSLKLDVKYFADQFFSSIHGYNKLVRSLAFYESYSDYEYILIYQLDAWVFSDQLTEWCDKGYDYIGAPWCKENAPPSETNPFVRSGNGGFSLRRTGYFINILSSNKKLFTPAGIKQKIERLKTNPRSIKRFARFLGYKTGFLNHIRAINNSARLEDWFWIENFANTDTYFPLRIPEPEISMYFAFEQWASYLFEKTSHTLPFGTHAYKKYEYETFWKNHIPDTL